MAQQKIELVFDLDAKDVQFATEKTLTLTEQIRILKKELQKTQEGTKEFEILKNKLNETKDNFERVNVKSRELFGTLSLIPGPIGEIAGKVNGAISLLKTFSGFSLKDITSQFKALGDDLKSIFMNLGSFGEATDKATEAQENLNTVVKDGNQINLTAGAQIQQNIAQENSQVETLKKKIQVEKTYQGDLKAAILAQDEIIQKEGKRSEKTKEATELRKIYSSELQSSIQYEQRYNTELQSLTNSQNKNTVAAQKDAVAQAEVAGASQTATVATTTQTVATKALTTAQNAASAAGRILKGVLASLGIGLIILAVTTLITKLYEWATSTKEADAANEKLGETISELSRILDANISKIDEQIQIDLIRAKIAGKTEKEINDLTIQGIDKRIAAYKKGNEAIFRELLLLEANFKLTEEQRRKRADELTQQYLDNGKKILDAESQRRIQVVKGDEIEFNTRQKNNEKAAAQRKKNADDKLAEDKAQLDARIQLLINEKNTDKKQLEDLLEQRLKLENLSGDKLKLAREENRKKVEDALKEDFQREYDIRLKSIEAIIQAEQNAQDVDVERLKKLLLHKRDLELQAANLLPEEKKAIIARTNKEIRDIELKQAEDKLVEDLAAARGNFDAQIQLYQQYAQQAISSEQYTQQEKVKIIEDTNRKILELQQEQFDARLTAVQLEFGGTYAYQKDYYDKVSLLYEEEKRKYKNLLDTKQIDQATYDAFIAQSTAAEIQLEKEKLNAKMENFEAVSGIFAATASLVGEQTKAGKALAIAGATIDTYVAANKVLSDPTPMPTFLRFALAAASIIRGLASVRKIIDTKIPTAGGGTEGGGTPAAQFNQGPIQVQGRAQGGMINGPGTSTSDSIPAMLSDGEFVINARSTKMFQPLLQAINSYGVNTPRFQAGGLVMGARTAQQQTNEISLTDAIATTLRREPIRTYVTSAEVTNQQQFDRIIKSRSLI